MTMDTAGSDPILLGIARSHEGALEALRDVQERYLIIGQVASDLFVERCGSVWHLYERGLRLIP